MSLLTDQDLVLWALRTNSAALIHSVTDQRELRLSLTDNTRNHFSSMDANLYVELFTILQRNSIDILLYNTGEVHYSDRMVAAKKA